MSKSLKCFISAPSFTDTSNIRRILSRSDVTAYDAFDINLGDSVKDSLVVKIKEADFVVVVIPDITPNVFYEMGICEGLGKPTFLVVGNDVQAPYFIQNHLYLRTNLKDEELLNISLSRFVDDFLADKYKHSVITKESKSRKAKTPRLKAYITEIEKLRTSRDPIKVELLTQEILQKLNIQVVSNQSKSQDKGVDFAIWDDNLTSVIGNPLFIEIKYGSLTPQRIYQAESQLKGYLEKSDAKASILLYLDVEGKRFSENYSLSPLILRFDFEDFVREISQSSFEKTIIAKRNSMVHGVS